MSTSTNLDSPPYEEQLLHTRRGQATWNEYVEAGRNIQHWIRDANEEGCKVPIISLTFSDFGEQGWTIKRFYGSFPTGCTHDVVHLGIPYTEPGPGGIDRSTVVTTMHWQQNNYIHSTHRWSGRVVEGVIFITNIERALGASRPWTSEIIKAVYEESFPLDTLRHVFANVVINENTKYLVKNLLYTDARGLSWPDDTRRTWEYDTPEYQAILGTRIGKVVGYFVLGAFPRGTRRISQIVSWAGVLETITLRFELEEVEAKA